MGSSSKPVWICDACGYFWLQNGERKPRACQHCRSRLWDRGVRYCKRCDKLLTGKQIVFCSRTCKDRYKYDGKQQSGVWIKPGLKLKHHELCSCLVCLSEIVTQAKAKKQHGAYGLAREHQGKGKKANGQGAAATHSTKATCHSPRAKHEQLDTLSV